MTYKREKKEVIILFIDRILEEFETPSTLSKCSSCDNFVPCRYFHSECAVHHILRGEQTVSNDLIHSFIHSNNWMTKSILDKMLTTSQKFLWFCANVFIYSYNMENVTLIYFLLRTYFAYSKRFHLTRNPNYDFE